MISLTYISTAARPFTTAELGDLLATTRERNHAAGLTGVLLHAGGHFIQTLEGAEQAVEATFGRVLVDRRHRNVDVALREEIVERTFPDWSMGFASLSAEEAADLPGFNDYLTGGSTAGELASLGRSGVFHRVFRDTMR